MPNDPKSAIGKAAAETQWISGETPITNQDGTGSSTNYGNEGLAPDAETVNSPSNKPRRLAILLADDVEANQRIGRAVLEAAGLDVESAWHGVEAIRAVQARRYDLVLMDVQMPTMDGLEATRCIRALGHPAASVPIVALTSNIAPENVGAALAAGMNGHLGKPYKVKALLDVVDQFGIGSAQVKA